ncbi:putative F-box/kelch-repeat protein SKIP25-like [Capsicum annuum]|nr:putative F-box/kelch-repeat protein SKIP25-like [Capsicum annuum]
MRYKLHDPCANGDMNVFSIIDIFYEDEKGGSTDILSFGILSGCLHFVPLWKVLAGSYFSVAGALIGILKPGRMSMFGTLLIVWGLIKEGILTKPTKVDPERAVYVYPTMLLALVCSFLSVKYDMKKVTRGAPSRPVAKPLQSSSKAKLK